MGKFFYLLIPILSWILITLPLWLSPFHPAVVSYFIIAFDLYFFYKAIITVIRSSIAYKKIQLFTKTNFDKKIINKKEVKKINHFVIIPNYKESLVKLEETIKAIINCHYPFKKNIFLVLAFEEREKEAWQKEKFLVEKYKKYFKDILVSYHRLLPEEEAGKASNQTAACLKIEEYLNDQKEDFKNILITVCDADSRLPKNYFSYLTYQYLTDKDRFYHFYAAPVLLYGNFWRLPLFIRLQTTLSSVLRLAFLEYGENFIQISTYSASFWLLKQVNFWDTNIIPEDWHIYLQAFFKFGKKVKTIPLYTIIDGDAVYSGSVFKTSLNRYQQEKRWAWGVTDIGYALNHFFNTPHINPLDKLAKIIFIAENHLLWPTSFFILTLSASIPPLINPVFKRTVLGFLLPKIAAFILTLATICLIFYIYLDIKLRKKVNQTNKLVQLPFLIIQWYLLPIVSFFFSSLPALEAHTRLIFGKKIKYHVTEKV